MKCYYFYIVYLIIFSLNVNAQRIDDKDLVAQGFYPLQSIKSDINYLGKNWIKLKEVSLEDINDDFTNIEDLKWLKNVSKENKAIFIGENHFNRNTQNLRNRILFTLNKYDYYPIIILEEPYPITAFANYYIRLTSDKQANEFNENELSKLIPTKEECDLLLHLRRWNKTYPDKLISIGYEDVEKTQDELSRTINQIIIPYFQRLDPSYTVNWERVLTGSFDSLILEFKQTLEQANRNNIIGKYPFITPTYISTVIENLESSNKTLYQDYFYNRQKAIIRNLTDTNFLGNYLQKGKIIIHSGALHLRTNIQSDSTNNLWEGTYLTNVFESTKGKTYSIRIDAITQALGEAAYIDYNFFEPALGFNFYYEKLHKAFKDSLINPSEYYFISIYNQTLDDTQRFWIQKGRDHNWQGLLIESILWDDVIKSIENKNPSLSRAFENNRISNSSFDKVIVIPCSPLVTPIIKINSYTR
jgi:hypothetical protein